MTAQDFPRWGDLVREIRAKERDLEGFFQDFDIHGEWITEKRKHYLAYESAFSHLDEASWNMLRAKAIRHFRDHREGQWKQGFFNQLNDAFAYEYLVKNGGTHVSTIEENGKTTPDISFLRDGLRRFCEVKTVGVSDDQIVRRASGQAFNAAIYVSLSDYFLKKLSEALDKAHAQITAHGDGLVYLIIHFDDITPDNHANYRKQLLDHFESQKPSEICARFGVMEDEFIHWKR